MRQELGVGGSDAGVIMGINPYISALELFYQKLGLHPQGSEDNESTFWGRQNEAAILRVAQYLDLDDGTYLSNAADGRRLRGIMPLPYMVQNLDRPGIFGNIDAGVDTVFTEEDGLHMDAIAEAKTISRQAREKWEGGLPPYYLFQALIYITVLEPVLRDKLCYIFVLEDGSRFSGWRVPLMEDLRDAMLDKINKFHSTLERGRDIVKTVKDPQKRHNYLISLEPEPDKTPAYEEYLSKHFLEKSQRKVIVGSPEILNIAKDYKRLNSEANKLDEKKQFIRNTILKYMRDNDAAVIDFGRDGKVSLGVNNRFYVNVGKKDVAA
jgi:predicted phage-related endonuclease